MRTVSLFGQINNGIFPMREYVENLTVGSLAPDYAGRLCKVVEVFGWGHTAEGLAYVCYYVEHGGGRISDSLVENTLHRNMNLTRCASSTEIDRAERILRGAL